jgi:hypothetical protein
MNVVSQLVDEAYAVHATLAAGQARLDEICGQLIALGRGDYAGSDPAKVAKVIVPSAPTPGYKLEPDNEERAREIAGENFGEVFVRKVTFSCEKAFEVVCQKFLTPAKAKKLLALCLVKRKTQDPYVNFA